MTLLPRAVTILVLCAVAWMGTARLGVSQQTLSQSVASPTVPLWTDDGQDPIELIFTGYAPSWWVASNMVGWTDTTYCSGPKLVDGLPYNNTLQHPDPTGIPCYGPRDHIRIWDMGYSPIFGVWSVASAHHEYTDPLPVPHHVIDSWERAEADVRSAFLGGQSTLSISNYTLANAGDYQGVYFDGNATMIQLRPPAGHYPVVFSETGLGNHTSWSVTLNETAITSPRPDIVFDVPNSTYQFQIGVPAGFNTSPATGTLVVNGSLVRTNVHFTTPWTSSSASITTGGRTVSIGFTGNATVATSTIQVSTGRNTTLSFTAAEIGSLGALNVTVPKSIVPAGSSTSVYIDGAPSSRLKLTLDRNSYYAYFLLQYGTHSVQLRFAGPMTQYLEYFLAGATAVGIIGGTFLVFRFRLRKRALTTLVPVSIHLDTVKLSSAL